jgi:5-methylcytosine-specific restriction endonuclease McrA
MIGSDRTDYGSWRERYGGQINWLLIRATVFMRDGYTCILCKKREMPNKLRVHHVLPLAKGGTNELRNLITVCRECHQYIHPKNYNIW